jgi:hypothetical protein
MSSSMSVPLDADGYLRRECPTCERQFKWHPGDDDFPIVDQYFCPLCGVPAGLDDWWTQEQLDHAQVLLMPEAMRVITDALGDAFKNSKHVTYKPSQDVHGDVPAPDVLHEPDDMVIVEPPCHPAEPLKVPEGATARLHCLICGELFAT